MLFKGVLLDKKPEYVARLENGVLVAGFDDGTAIDSSGGNYRLVAEYDDDENMISQCWQPV
ncbi:MAG: hypothetical protein IKK37_05915 [Clostridia bacterium]|nr:hypothetical protein [Clostridia bacterium]